MSVWWVNHKQTYKHERGGGYIWSPKTMSNGAQSHFYDNMLKIAPGDTIISFANSLVSDIGVARSSASSAALPTSYLKAGENWDRGNGWLVPIEWQSLQLAVRPQDIINELAPLLPDKYSPLQKSNGHGNQAAYLCAISEDVLHLILSKATRSDERGLTALRSQLIAEDPEDAAGDAIERTIIKDPALSATEKEGLSKARRGQGQFRNNLLAVESQCRLTGIKDPQYLIASHILAWSACSTSHERLDGHNGLLLTPNADKLFDRHLISFTNDGEVWVSKTVQDVDLARLGLGNIRTMNVGAFKPEQCVYLDFHRKGFELFES